MPKTKISEFSATPANNTDIDSINIAEGCAPSGINDAIRELMSQLKDWQAGTSNDPMVIGTTGSLTLNQGTANGVPYLNGSKVVTSGTALTFDGTTLGLGTTLNAWGGTSRALQIGTNASFIGRTDTNDAFIGINFYRDSSNVYRYAATDFASYSQISKDSFYWYTAPSGTAGSTITFTQKMVLDSRGNFGLGVDPSAWATLVPAFQLGAGGSFISGRSTNPEVYVGTNTYFNGANYIYKTSNVSTLYAQDTGNHKWYYAASGTAGNTVSFTQSMTLDSGGNLFLNTTSNAALQNNNSLVVRAVGDTTQNHANGTASGSGYLFFGYNAGVIGSITQTGTTAVLFNTTSDQRLKENIKDSDSASNLIDSLKVRQFDWKSDNSHQRYGFIAQEIITVAPEAVHQPENTDQMMAVDYSKLVPMLVKEVQSLRARVAQLESN